MQQWTCLSQTLPPPHVAAIFTVHLHVCLSFTGISCNINTHIRTHAHTKLTLLLYTYTYYLDTYQHMYVYMYVCVGRCIPSTTPLTPQRHFDKADASPLSPPKQSYLEFVLEVQALGSRFGPLFFPTLDNNKQVPIFTTCHIPPTELAFATWQRGSLDYS